MNAITKAIQEVKFRIPLEVLNLAFTGNSMISLDERINISVLRARVLVDCNVVGGVEIKVPLSSANLLYHGPDGFVVSFPKSATNGRSILSAEDIVSSQHLNIPFSAYVAGDLFQSGMKMVNNLADHGITLSSSLEMVGENTVFVHEDLPNIESMTMTVTVENDMVNMNNINVRSYPMFSQLCTLATKAFIYNKLIVMLDKGYIHTGHDLGMVKQIIDNYESADEEYRDYLMNTWMAVAFMNDGQTMDWFVQSMFNNNI